MPPPVARLYTNHSRMRLATKRWAGVPRIWLDRLCRTNWEDLADPMWIGSSGSST